MYEYTSDVFAVGLEGFAPVDDKKITAMAAEGWEPTHMTTVHNGFAAVVLFRREGGPAGRAPARAAAGRVRKAPAKATPAKATKAPAKATKAARSKVAP
ncbi:MAG: hypothetical protein ACRD0S_12715, partial [Acidimicrobiales bacterium]